MEALEILETCLYVTDLDAAEHFYREVLGLEPIAKVEGRHVFFALGQSVLLLFNPDASSRSEGLPGHGARGPGHCCFKLGETAYEAWKNRLARHDVTIIAEQDWPGGAKSCYFHDPAGNVLELAPARIWGLSRARSS